MILVALAASPAHAVVGGAPVATDDAARAVVLVIGLRGNLCSGALIAPDIVLTAAHCVHGNKEMRVAVGSGTGRRNLVPTRIALHPRYAPQDMARHRATADVALLQLAKPLDLPPLAVGVPSSVATERPHRIVGSGVTRMDDGASIGMARSAALVTTGTPGPLQMRLFDPSTRNARPGLGACTGDSGGPVTEQQNGRATIVGVMSWSTAANNAGGCGGLTGATPLTLYRAWIETTIKGWR
jgi:secreted trypsin-like serine protease